MTSTPHIYIINIIINSLFYFHLIHHIGSSRSSEHSTSRSDGNDGNTTQLTTSFSEDTTSRSGGSDGTAFQLTGSLHSSSKNTARNAKKPIRGPPELLNVLPSLADISVKTKPSKHADLPVDVLLLTVKICEFLACYSELKNPYRRYIEGVGYVYFSDVDGSQEKVKVALLRCFGNSSFPGGSLIGLKNVATVLRPKAVVFVGACSSLHPEKAKLGDVVVSAKLTTYASKVVINNQGQSTGVRSYVSKRFLDVIKNCANGWQAPLKNLADAEQVQVYTAAEFLTGPERVISGERRDQLAETNPQAVAVESEGEGRWTDFLQPVFISRCTQPGQALRAVKRDGIACIIVILILGKQKCVSFKASNSREFGTLNHVCYFHWEILFLPEQ